MSIPAADVSDTARKAQAQQTKDTPIHGQTPLPSRMLSITTA
ncbi:MAG: hypothetical protein OXI63_17700 [Candidatus Poribacteria bacterium]|nr:hypothetical protein [Candidatus Poribacteria bacterium]